MLRQSALFSVIRPTRATSSYPRNKLQRCRACRAHPQGCYEEAVPVEFRLVCFFFTPDPARHGTYGTARCRIWREGVDAWHRVQRRTVPRRAGSGVKEPSAALTQLNCRRVAPSYRAHCQTNSTRRHLVSRGKH